MVRSRPPERHAWISGGTLSIRADHSSPALTISRFSSQAQGTSRREETVPDEDAIEVIFSAAEGSKLEKLVAKIGDHPIGGPGSPYKGACKAPAGAWKLRWEIRGTRQ